MKINVSQYWQQSLLRYGLAVLATLAAFLCRLALEALLNHSMPVITFFPAVMLSAWYGGFGPGLLTTAMGGLLALCFFIQPGTPFVFVTVALYAFVGALSAWLTDSFRLARKRAEYSERKLVNILESMGDACVACDSQWRYEYVNEQAIVLVRKTREELLGNVIWEVFPELRNTSVHTAMQNAMHERVPSRFEHYYAPYGIWVEGSVYPMAEGVTLFMRDITPRKQAEVALRESEERFRVLAESIPGPIFLTDASGQNTYTNRAFQLFTGCASAELLGSGWLQAIHPDDRDTAASAWAQAVRLGQPYATECRLRSAQGDYHWHLCRGAPVCDEQGRIHAWVGIGLDVEEQKQAEAALRATEFRIRNERERLLQIFQQAPVALAFLHGEDLVYEVANARYKELLPNRELLGRPVTEAIPELDERVVEILRHVLHSGETFRAEEFSVPLDRDQDGVVEEYWFDVLYHPVIEPDGTISGVISMASDATSKVHSKRQIEHQWRLFDTALSHIPDYVYIFDSEGRFTYANRTFVSLLGRSMEQIVGRTLHEVNYPPEIAAKITAQIRQVFETGETIWDETWFTRSDHEKRLFEYMLAPVFRDDGTVEAVAGSSRDITDRRKTVKELQRSNAELIRTNRELEEFAYVASHDLQEPLRMVSVYTQLLLRRFNPEHNEQLNQYAWFIRQGVRRMDQLIQDLLSFSRTIHAEQVTRPADLNVSVQEALSTLQEQIKQSAAVITIDQLPTVQGDEAQLSHVFQNLLSNSLKYCRPGIAPQIDISAQHVDEESLITVRDNGIGFEQQYATRIFGLFKRLHKDEYPGTGLGLAICQRVVERYGGRIWAESRPGEGATFYFALKRVKGND